MHVKEEKLYQKEISELEQDFSFDLLEHWASTADLVDLANIIIKKHFPKANPHFFVHVEESREYREINCEGIAAIPEDSLFISCLSMCSNGSYLKTFFDDFLKDEVILRSYLETSYNAYYILPIVHRFSLLGFILFCNTEKNISALSITEADSAFLTNLTSRIKINLYAAFIADSRQRDLLCLAEFPVKLREWKTLEQVSKNLLEVLSHEISFDSGVYYEYQDYLDRLVSVAWKGINHKPHDLNTKQGISGRTADSKKTIFILDRSKHPYFSLISDEPFLTDSIISVPIQTENHFIGVISLSRNQKNSQPFTQENRYTLEIIASFIATEITNKQFYNELEQSYFTTVSSLTRALEAKDTYTRGHSERVMSYSVGIAQELNLSLESIRRIRYGAILHDIGKIGISDTIISKESSLTESEYSEIKRHTEIGFDIVNDNQFFTEIRDLIKYHHEKMDGTGYYAKHNGDYPWEAMIISLADIYDALTSDRPYRKALLETQALKILKTEVGIHFDDRIYRAFNKYLEKIRTPDNSLT